MSLETADHRTEPFRARTRGKKISIIASSSSSFETHSSDLIIIKDRNEMNNESPTSKVRTNWASFPEGSGSEAVILTRAQITSGCVSVPKARCDSIFGTVENGIVTLIHEESCKKWEINHRLYASQPTQVFLQGLKSKISILPRMSF